MKFKVIYLLTIIFLLLLPYYIFEGKLYLGGDDTRLFYSYPLEFLKNATFFSWYKVSSLGINGPSQYLAPFLVVVSALDLVLANKLVLNCLALSTPLILGFIFFQESIKELFQLDNEKSFELFAGSLFYILSPILLINQYFVFLISIWLLGLIPIVVYYFLKYLRTSDFKYVFIASLWCLFLSFALYTVPWLLGFVIPVSIGLICTSFLYKRKEVSFFVRHIVVFSIFISISQAFWLTGFISTYLNLGQDSFASKFLSQGFVDTFTPTILSTATGNIFYPLLNLFHRQIPFDFGWKLKDVFIGYYDLSFALNSLYVVLFTYGLVSFKKHLPSRSIRLFILLLVSFFFSIYFFTVNIGPLKDLFILFGQVPGFTMFRNFYDKFAPGYVILYATIITMCLIFVTSKFEKFRNLIITVFILVVLINFVPVKQIVNSPLWTTKDIYKTVTIPEEHLGFMNDISNTISSTNNIFNFPFGSSAYSVIVDPDSNKNVYAGVSPVKIFSGVNDISGHLSFNYTEVANIVDGMIVKRDYEGLNKILYEHNINYVLVTKNIPRELADSYIYNSDLFRVQDNDFLDAITSEEVLSSSKGNYELYKTREKNSLISSKNVFFKKINQVKYKIYIKNIKDEQELVFLDSFHKGWKLYPKANPSLDFCKDPKENKTTNTRECREEHTIFEWEDLSYSFREPVFEDTQDVIYDYANKWVIDPGYIERAFDEKYYKRNEDGSIDIELILYFAPQNYFYLGSAISLIVFVGGFTYLIIRKNETKK